jgi:hypothetical protein
LGATVEVLPSLGDAMTLRVVRWVQQGSVTWLVGAGLVGLALAGLLAVS